MSLRSVYIYVDSELARIHTLNQDAVFITFCSGTVVLLPIKIIDLLELVQKLKEFFL